MKQFGQLELVLSTLIYYYHTTPFTAFIYHLDVYRMLYRQVSENRMNHLCNESPPIH